VPLEAVTHALKAAKQRLPALAHVTPRTRLGKRGRWRTGILR
jgi:hypothetical protein